MSIPTVFINALKSIPTKDLDHLCSMIKCEYRGQRLNTKLLVEVFEAGDITSIKRIYTSVAPILMVGGMAPGVGLACNVIDAAFCFIIGNWMDFAIDAIAICFFEVPGVSGLKGLSKGLLALCKNIKIDARAFWTILEKLKQVNLLQEGKVHQLFSFLMDPSNSFIRFVDVKAIAASEMNVFKWGNAIVSKVISECEACGIKGATAKGLSFF